eukprot:CAMPEP_0169091158 /NCGR_PEP_ID=MMETSP1015-20121227/16211_1 /TAXON_ID=342587 /ORGANISM="Karlodinium micrum, Strain CCMP2283" /LENGTH=83 /DNA_ID=CAMNT_0009151627 /DNA_START=639 /DNA_END=890 /DNA_ORIENTATION=-
MSIANSHTTANNLKKIAIASNPAMTSKLLARHFQVQPPYLAQPPLRAMALDRSKVDTSAVLASVATSKAENELIPKQPVFGYL